MGVMGYGRATLSVEQLPLERKLERKRDLEREGGVFWYIYIIYIYIYKRLSDPLPLPESRP